MSQNILKIEASPIDTDELFQELLNETHEPLKIGSLEYLAGDALRKLDPIAFRCEVSNYIDSLLSDGELTEINGEYFWTSGI
jgi:hypothetical protein